MHPFLFIVFLCCAGCAQVESRADASAANQLLGDWQVDLTPADRADDVYALLRFAQIDDAHFTGAFYHADVPMRQSRLQWQSGVLYGAFVTADASGEYHSSFRFQNGQLSGTTHALQRDFLSVCSAQRITAGDNAADAKDAAR